MADLSSLVGSFAGTKVLCIGDLMLDVINFGIVERICPEAPVPVLDLQRQTMSLGGAGSLLAHLASLGAKVTQVAAVGNDAEAEHIQSLLREKGCGFDLVIRNDAPTITKTRFIAGNQQLLRADREKRLDISGKMKDDLLAKVRKASADCDFVVLADYCKGLLTAETTPEIIKICTEYNRPVFVDPKGKNIAKYFGARLLKPNLKEFKDMSGVDTNPEDADFKDKMRRGADEIFAKTNSDALLVTLDKYGMAFIGHDLFRQIPSKALKIVDVIGAGDSTFAVFMLAFNNGASVPEAMEAAATAAAIAVGKVGTSPVEAKELRDALS